MQGGWVAQQYYFFAKKRRSPFPRVVEGFRFLNLVMILIRYLNTCKKRLGQNLMVCKKAPAIFSSRLQFAKTLFCMVGGWLVCFKAIVFFCRTQIFRDFRTFLPSMQYTIITFRSSTPNWTQYQSLYWKKVCSQAKIRNIVPINISSIYYYIERSL